MTYIKELEAQVESYAAYLRREERSQSRAYNQSLDSGEDGIMGTLEIPKIKYIWQSAMEQRRKPSRKAQAIWSAPPFLQAGKAPTPSYQPHRGLVQKMFTNLHQMEKRGNPGKRKLRTQVVALQTFYSDPEVTDLIRLEELA